MPRTQAFQNLNIPTSHKVALCLDGGGVRGALTLRLLERLESVAGIPCYELFDLVAGTSTGGIIAGLIATKRTATEILALYRELIESVFEPRNPFASRFLNPPAYTKQRYRSALKQRIGDVTLKQVSEGTDLDLLITSQDAAEAEETFFSCFRGKPDGAYQDVLLRAAMEATMSAPTYFRPLERFVDGGATSYNNPSLAAILEATKYGPVDGYRIDQLTVFSLGTGCAKCFATPEQVEEPKGLDVKFWLDYVMGQSSTDASEMQVDFLRAGSIPGLDYRRFQISLDALAMAKLPDAPFPPIESISATTLHSLTDGDLSKVAMDQTRFMPLLETIGVSMADFICASPQAPFHAFSGDLADTAGNDLLVTRRGAVAQIASQMGDPTWIDRQEA